MPSQLLHPNLRIVFKVLWAGHKDNKPPDTAKQEGIVKHGSKTMTHADARHLGWCDSHALSCLLAEQHRLTRAGELGQLNTSSCKQDTSASSNCKELGEEKLH